VLTSQGSRQIRENIVGDINADVLVDSAPKQRLSSEAALLFNKSVVARPLMVPEVCSIRIKNLEYRYRWVNRGGRNGQIYMQRKAQGFTNATLDDVEVLGGDASSTGGEIVAGDVILMKIRADIYDAAIKYNMEKANMLQRSRGMYLKNTSPDVNSDAVAQPVSVAQEQFAHTGKASNFIPDNPEALLSRSASLGGVDAAREQSNEIRDKIKAERTSKGSTVQED
jgi:hypothetical protein